MFVFLPCRCCYYWINYVLFLLSNIITLTMRIVDIGIISNNTMATAVIHESTLL